MGKTSVMIVDDHSVVRMGLTAIINLEKDLMVCGEAENGAEAIQSAVRLKPDVIVMDLVMSDMDGAEATSGVLKVYPPAKILILTTFGTSDDLRRAITSGAIGAVTKNISNAELADAIRKTAAGESYFSQEIRQTLEESAVKPTFTSRQMEVIDSITRGLSNDDIAIQLGLSKTRVKQHLNEIYSKLGAANRAEAVAVAMRRHITKH